MTRLLFPDEGSRLVYNPSSSALLAPGTVVEVYLDAAATQPALDLLDATAEPLTTGLVLTDTQRLLPLFYGPDNGQDTLYVRVNGGPLTAIYARTDERLDALAARLAAVESFTTSAVSSVNTQTGDVLLDAADVGAATPGDVAAEAAARTAAVAAEAAARADAIAAEVAARVADVDAEEDARTAADLLALPKAGGTLTGPLTLAGDPTANLHAATRQWVVAQLAQTVTDMVNGAPGALDTFGELVAQLGADESGVAALTATVAGKLAKGANLADLVDVVAARLNLGLGSAAVAAAADFDPAGAAASEAMRAQSAEAALDTRLSAVGPPSGAAGGVLTGTYPNPALANGAVGDAQVDGTRPISESKLALASDAPAATPSRRSIGQGAGQVTPGALKPRKTTGTFTPDSIIPFPTSVIAASAPSNLGYVYQIEVIEPFTIDAACLICSAAGTSALGTFALYASNADGNALAGLLGSTAPGINLTAVGTGTKFHPLTTPTRLPTPGTYWLVAGFSNVVGFTTPRAIDTIKTTQSGPGAFHFLNDTTLGSGGMPDPGPLLFGTGGGTVPNIGYRVSAVG